MWACTKCDLLISPQLESSHFDLCAGPLDQHIDENPHCDYRNNVGSLTWDGMYERAHTCAFCRGQGLFDNLVDHYNHEHVWCALCEDELLADLDDLHFHCVDFHLESYCSPCRLPFDDAGAKYAHDTVTHYYRAEPVAPLSQQASIPAPAPPAPALPPAAPALPPALPELTRKQKRKAIRDNMFKPTNASFNGRAFECYLCHRPSPSLTGLFDHIHSSKHQFGKDIFRKCPGAHCTAGFLTLSALWEHIESGVCGVRRFTYKKAKFSKRERACKRALRKAWARHRRTKVSPALRIDGAAGPSESAAAAGGFTLKRVQKMLALADAGAKFDGAGKVVEGPLLKKLPWHQYAPAQLRDMEQLIQFGLSFDGSGKLLPIRIGPSTPPHTQHVRANDIRLASTMPALQTGAFVAQNHRNDYEMGDGGSDGSVVGSNDQDDSGMEDEESDFGEGEDEDVTEEEEEEGESDYGEEEGGSGEDGSEYGLKESEARCPTHNSWPIADDAAPAEQEHSEQDEEDEDEEGVDNAGDSDVDEVDNGNHEDEMEDEEDSASEEAYDAEDLNDVDDCEGEEDEEEFSSADESRPNGLKYTPHPTPVAHAFRISTRSRTTRRRELSLRLQALRMDLARANGNIKQHMAVKLRVLGEVERIELELANLGCGV